MTRPLHNYLRPLRRRTGLSQEEVAALLGIRSGTSVLRHEDDQRLPGLRATLAYAALYRLDLRSLFAGHFEDVEMLVRARARKMLAQMDTSHQNPSASRKRNALAELVQSPDLHYVPWPED